MIPLWAAGRTLKKESGESGSADFDFLIGYLQADSRKSESMAVSGGLHAFNSAPSPPSPWAFAGMTGRRSGCSTQNWT